MSKHKSSKENINYDLRNHKISLKYVNQDAYERMISPTGFGIFSILAIHSTPLPMVLYNSPSCAYGHGDSSHLVVP